MKLEIKKIGIDGDGIGYEHYHPIFVKGALINEVVDCKIDHDFGKYKTATLNYIEKESNYRNYHLCSAYKYCGGCNIQHAKYEEQLRIKANLLKQSLIKYANLDLDVDIEASKKEINYRNSLKLPFCTINGQLETSLYENNTNHFVCFDKCLNHEEILEKTRLAILALANEYHLKAYDRHLKKGLRYLYMRHLSDGIQICLVTGEDNLNKEFVYKVSKLEKVVSLYQNINISNNSHALFGKQSLHLSGSSKLRFKVNDLNASLSIKSFYQMNSLQAAKMYEYVSSLIPSNQKLIVEAYCGIGIMSLLNANKANKVIGIEIIIEAIINAKNNAEMNNIDNCEFICGDASEELKYLSKKNKIDTLIVDPPRNGLDDLMLINILKSNIQRIVYVSCNDVTLAQNLAALSKKYRIESLKAFDMFPNTTHVETVVCLSNKNAKPKDYVEIGVNVEDYYSIKDLNRKF